MGRATVKKLAPSPGALGKGQKGKISFNFNYKVNFKDFYSNFVCVLTNERYKTYQTGILILLPGSCPRGGTLGRWECPGGQFFFQTWSNGILNRRG